MLNLLDEIEIKLWIEGLLADISTNIDENQQRASGATQAALRSEITPDSITGYGPAHIDTLEFGRPPGLEPGETIESLTAKIRQWINDKPGFHARDPDSAAASIAKRIEKRGTRLYEAVQEGGVTSGTLSSVLTEERITDLRGRLQATFVRQVRSEFMIAS